MTRTLTSALPVPKLARVIGAYTEVRRDPNWLLSTAVAAITSEASGSGALGLSGSRLAAGNPCASSAEHITGSQDTIVPPPTCCSIHAAAALRAACAVRTGFAPPSRGRARRLPAGPRQRHRQARPGEDRRRQGRDPGPPPSAPVSFPPQPDGGGDDRGPGRLLPRGGLAPAAARPGAGTPALALAGLRGLASPW